MPRSSASTASQCHAQPFHIDTSLKYRCNAWDTPELDPSAMALTPNDDLNIDPRLFNETEPPQVDFDFIPSLNNKNPMIPDQLATALEKDVLIRSATSANRLRQMSRNVNKSNIFKTYL